MCRDGFYRGKIIFDLDGVITGEERYWDAAALTVGELLFSPRFLALPTPAGLPSFRPDPEPSQVSFLRKVVFKNGRVITFFKERAVNSNWDLAFLTFSFQLLMLFRFLDAQSTNILLRLPLKDSFSIKHLALMAQLLSLGAKKRCYWSPDFDAVLNGWAGAARGPGLAVRLAALLPGGAGRGSGAIFAPRSLLWRDIQKIFQEWYLGDQKIKQDQDREPLRGGKKGLINSEEPILPAERIRAALTRLRHQGWILGIATGRPRDELHIPLQQMGLWPFFDPKSVATYSEVEKTERNLGEDWTGILGKPHPFSFLKAYWENIYQDRDLVLKLPLPQIGRCWVVGDSLADLLAARKMKAPFIGVLTGPGGPACRDLFKKEGAAAVLADVTHLPSFFAARRQGGC